jgi:hypothetical protein
MTRSDSLVLEVPLTSLQPIGLASSVPVSLVKGAAYILRTRLAFVLLIVLALAGLMQTAKAGVIYTYTGNDFTAGAYGGYSTSDFITGSITLASPLPDNFTGDEYFSPTAFSVSAGSLILDQSNSYLTDSFEVYGTDANGVPLYWQLQLVSDVQVSSIQTDNLPD